MSWSESEYHVHTPKELIKSRKAALLELHGNCVTRFEQGAIEAGEQGNQIEEIEDLDKSICRDVRLLWSLFLNYALHLDKPETDDIATFCKAILGHEAVGQDIGPAQLDNPEWLQARPLTWALAAVRLSLGEQFDPAKVDVEADPEEQFPGSAYKNAIRFYHAIARKRHWLKLYDTEAATIEKIVLGYDIREQLPEESTNS